MNSADMIRRPCTLLLRTGESRDAHGNPVNRVVRRETVCELQAESAQGMSANEIIASEIASARWRLWLLPADGDITNGDGIIVDGLEYEVASEVWPIFDPFERNSTDHIECVVERTAGSAEVS